MKLAWLLVLVLGTQLVESRPAQIIMIRHAEEPSGSSIHLSAKGQRRAEALMSFFTENTTAIQFGEPAALFAVRPRLNGSRRSLDTLLPTAERLGRPVRQQFTEVQFTGLARKVLNNPAFNGKTVVIAWTHDHMNQLAAALGVQPMPRNWRKKDFDRAWCITYQNGQAKLSDMPQDLLPGDSEEVRSLER